MPSGYAKFAIETGATGNEDVTPTPTTKVLYPPLQELGLKLGVAPLSRDDELRNQDEPLAVIPDALNPSWDLKTRAYPDSMAFLLQLVCGAPTTAAGDGIITDTGSTVIPTGAYRHRWTAPFGPSGVSPKTATVNVSYTDQAEYFAMRGAAAESLSVETPEEGGAQLSVSGPAAYLDNSSSPGASPSYEALTVKPFTRGGLSLTNNLSGTGTVEDFSFSISNPVEVGRSLGIDSKWPDLVEKSSDGGPVVVSGEIPHRQLDTTDIDALMASTGFALTARWVSDTIIASSYPYKMFLSCSNAQFVDGDAAPLKNVRRHGASFSWKSTTASTGSTVIEVVNSVSSYS